MRQLPTGIVTFFFTDIESCTTIAERLGSGWDQVLDDHNEIVGSSIAAFGGRTVGTEGDSFFAVFLTPDAAIGAALDAQRRLRAHPWPPDGQVNVRMGAHTGVGRLRRDFYVGVDIIKAARISDAAHGGQMLVSEATRSQLGPELHRSVELRDMGKHRLKGLKDAERLFQLVVDDLPSEFPPLRSQGPPSNLPQQSSQFVGREQELRTVSALLHEHRLVTLTGVGGTGKTRLAIRVATDALDRFAGGVYFVALDAIDDPDRVAPAIASVVGASQFGDPVEAIVAQIGARDVLLIVDNFEQVAAAGVVLTDLLAACPGVHVLVTSRHILRLRAEQAYPVSPLGLPIGSSLDAIREADSVSLLVRRAAAADPSFELTDENAADVAAIVSRLDGLPLAIELAAARIRLFGLGALRTQLAGTTSILAGGFIDAPERHRSLDLTIGWSYGLLDAPAQAMLRRASVFAGGFSLEAAEALCGGAPVDNVTEVLAGLLDTSLIGSTISEGAARFRILETVRSFGLARLADAGETEDAFRAHADYFTAMASVATEGLRSNPGVEHLEAEQANLAAALEWCAGNDPDRGLRALPALVHSHAQIGALDEGRQLAEKLLEAGGSDEHRLTGLLAAGTYTYWLNDYTAAATHYAEAIDLATGLGDEAGLADALFGQAFSFVWLDRLDEAEAGRARALELFERLGNEQGRSGAAACEAFISWLQGDFDQAAALFGKVIDLLRSRGDVSQELFMQLALSGILMIRRRHAEAAAVALHALDHFAEKHDEGGLVHSLDWLGVSATALTPEEGLVIAGAADSLKDRRGGFIVLGRLGVGEPRALAADALPARDVESLWLIGRELALDEAVSLAQRWGTAHDIAPAPLDPDSMVSPS